MNTAAETPFEFLSSRDAAAAILRERETRHWTIAQRREHLGEDWPRETARITAEADAAVEWYMEALAQLRGAWNAHFKACPEPLLNIPPPTWEQIREWQDVSSDTASADPSVVPGGRP